MALTAEQEAKLAALADAMDGTARIDQLANTIDLSGGAQGVTIEVMKDGESGQANLGDLLLSLEDVNSYGIGWDTTNPSPLCTRIGSGDLHRSLPLQTRIRGCLLGDDGAMVEYLTADSWRAHDLSGARGQVMVELPEHYRRFYTDGTSQGVRLSAFPLSGYHRVPRMYISAYEACLDSASKLASLTDGTTLPKTSYSLAQFRAAARARGTGAQWNCLAYEAYKSLFWLYFVEYANLNSQDDFTAAKDANGFAQGGLGAGVTTLPSDVWNTLNSYNPFIPCGYTDEFGNGSGVKDYTVSVGGTPYTVSVPRYRGIENIFGHIWKYCDGIVVDAKSDADGGTSEVYICDDPTKFSDSDLSGYAMRGIAARDDGYISAMLMGEYGDIIPSTVEGGSTSYWCDFFYKNTVTQFCSVLLSSTAIHGVEVGLSSAYLYAVNSPSDNSFGSRLCFIPQA